MKKFFLIGLPSLLFAVNLFALQEFYALSRSIRSLGMGGAFYGLSDDEYALLYNPTGLSFYRGEYQLMLSAGGQLSSRGISALSSVLDTSGQKSESISTVLNKIQSIQGRPFNASLTVFPHFITKNFGLGFILADTKLNFAFLGKEIDTEVEATILHDSAVLLGYSRQILEKFHLGLTGKILFRSGGRKAFTLLDIAQKDSLDIDPQDIGGYAVGLDFDIGTTYILPTLPVPHLLESRVSLVLNNAMASDFPIARPSNNKLPPALARLGSIGTVFIFKGWRFIDNFIFLFDLSEFDLGGQKDPHLGARSGSFWKHVNWGVEMPMWRRFYLRAGFNQGRVSAGLGVHLKVLRVDFATYGIELASGLDRLTNRRFALQLSFGDSAISPSPYTAHQTLSGIPSSAVTPLVLPPTDPEKPSATPTDSQEEKTTEPTPMLPEPKTPLSLPHSSEEDKNH